MKRKSFGFETLEERRLLAVQPFPTPLSSIGPNGSLVYQSTTSASIDTVVEVESFTVNLDAAQTLSVVVDPSAALNVSVAVRDPGGVIIGSAAANGQGLDEVVRALTAGISGVYTVDVSSTGNTTGNFNVKLVLNAELEHEGVGGPANDGPATAENIGNSFVPLGPPNASRGAVLGTLPGPIGVLFEGEDFESGALDLQWTTYSSQVGGRIQVTNAFGASSGSNALLMDRNPAGTTNLNEAIWTVNLAGLSDATLSFTHRDYADEQTLLPASFTGHANGDGVSISADGITWHTVLNATNVAAGVWAPVTIDLDAAAAIAGISLGADFRIKFQQYDESALTADGRGYDAIQIMTPAPQEDWYRFDLADGESASLALSRLSAGIARMELYAPDGTTLLATGVPGNSETQTIENFVDPAGGGATSTYFVRLVGTDAQYNLVVTRGADFEAGLTSSSESAAQDITLSGVILGHVGSGGLGGSPGSIKVGVLNTLDSNIVSQLSLAGMQASIISATDVEVGNLVSGGFDVVVTGRNYHNFVTQAFVNGMTSFVQMGGGIVSEWDDAALFFDGYHSTFRFPLGYPQMELLSGQIGGGDFLATGTPITQVVDHPIWAGLPAQFSASGGSEFFFTLYNYSTAQIEVIATFTGDGSIGFPNQQFPAAFVARDWNIVGLPFDWQDNPTDPNLVKLYTNAVQYAGSREALPDDYSLAVNAGDVLNIQALVPSSGPGEFQNELDVAIELYDPQGNLVASNAAGNLVYAAALTGAYTVRVLAENSTDGEYVLSVNGYTGGLAPFKVESSNPADGAAFQTPPSQIVVDLSDSMLLPSINASDLTIDGVPATNVTISDHNTLVFNLPVLSDGAHTLAIAAGAIQDLQGQSLEAFSMQLSIDTTPPKIVASSVLEGGVVEGGTLTYTVTFDEALDESVLDASDVQLFGLLNGVQTASTFAYDSGSRTLTLQFADVPEDSYTLTIFSGSFSVKDRAGNLLDGEANPATTVPSGNGLAGGNFSVNFIVDTTTRSFPPFVPDGPLGSLIYKSEVSGRIAPNTDLDQFTVTLDDNQRLTLLAAAEFQAEVTIFAPNVGPILTASSTGPGGEVLVQGMPILVAGTYTIQIRSLGGAIGNYSIKALLNSLLEGEQHGGPGNDNPVDAQVLDSAFIHLPDGTSQIAAVSGTVTGGTAGVLFEDTFPTPSFDPTKWSSVSNATIDSLGIGEPSEPFSARMNGDPVGGDAIVSTTVNLSQQTQATLSYWFQQTGGGETVDASEDLILWYQNSNGTWVELERQLGSGPSMTSYQLSEVVLPAAALHANFRFRITNIGTSGAFDDWFVDDVRVIGDSVVPDGGDWYRFSLNDGQNASIAMSSAADAGSISVDLYDSTGAHKLSSGQPGVNWLHQIQNYVDSTSDGAPNHYFLNVRGSNLDYQLAVTRGADLDFEQNNSPAQAQDIGGINHVLGHVSEIDDDWYQISVASGDVLTIAATAPGRGSGEFVNRMGEGVGSGVIISEVVDGTIGDGNPKFVEITNTGATPYTFTAGGLIVQSNNSSDRFVDVNLSGVTILPGQSFVIATDANDGQSVFESIYGFAADLYSDAFLGDGNDRFLLTDINDGSHILDAYGEIGVNGTGRAWEYTDSYAYRSGIATTATGANFDPSAWFFGGVNALETGSDVSEAQLLQSLTSPGTHQFVATGQPLVRVELYDPQGNLVEPAALQLGHVATQTGNYRLRVFSLAHAGEYVVAVDGATGANNPPEIVATIPVGGALLNQFPTSYTVTLSEPVLDGTLQASDLHINGSPAASSMTQLDALNYRFDLLPTVYQGDGTYTVTFAAGAFEDLSGQGNEVFSDAFEYDSIGPRVIQVLFNGAPLPLGGDLLAGALNVDVFFSEDLSAEFLPGLLGPEDVLLTNKLTGLTSLPTSVAYDPATNKATLSFAAIDESVYTITLISGTGAFEDRAGNALDGEPGGPGPVGTPSGNGVPGGNYVVQFQTDAVGARSIAPFERVRPLGSFMAESDDNVGVIGSAGDYDDFEIYVQSGQVLSAVLTPDDPQATVFLTLVGVAGPVFATGKPVALAPQSIPVSGPLTLRVFADRTTTYKLDVYANAAHELLVGDSANGNEMSLDGTRISVGPSRWGAIGAVNSTPSLSTIYSQDFNFDEGSFFFDNTSFGSGNGLWHRSTGRQLDGQPNHSPASSIYFGHNEGPLGNGNYDVGAVTAGAAYSPNIFLPTAEVILLSLNHLLATDGLFGSDVASISVSNGGDFVTLASTADGSLATSTNGQWNPITLDLSQFSGQSIYLRFGFDSITAAQNNFEGWYIDDVRIQAANSYLADIDEYTIDLTNYVGRPLDFIVAGQTNGALSGATIELLGPDGVTVVATASSSPLGVPAGNFDKAVLGYVPSVAGRYTLRIIADEPGEYGLTVVETARFEGEPNDGVSTSLRPIGPTNPALGFLGLGDQGGGGSGRLFSIDPSTRQIVEFEPESGAELNRIAVPGLANLGGPDGLAFNGTSLFYATDASYGGGTLYELDPNSGAVLDADNLTSIGVSSTLDGLGAFGGRIFTTDYSANNVYFIDTANDTVVKAWFAGVDIAGGATGAGDRGSIFVNNASNVIYEMDPSTGQILNTLAQPDSSIYGLAYVSGELLAGSTSGVIYRLNPNTGAVLGTFLTGIPIYSLGGDDASGTLSLAIGEEGFAALTFVGPQEFAAISRTSAQTTFLPSGVSINDLVAATEASHYASSGDASLAWMFEGAGLITTGEVEPNNSRPTANFVPLGFGVGQDPSVDVSGNLTSGDIDYFRVTLAAGDILGASASGSVNSLVLYNAAGQLMMGSTQNVTYIHPLSSPLQNAGNVAASVVISSPGDYYVGVSGFTGSYNLNLRTYRPVLENEYVGTRQTLFLDFNGATLDRSIFGAAGIASLSPLSAFLSGWELTASDENAVIDAIVASVVESLSTDMRTKGNNGDFAASGIPGQFDIEILNSRDHADQFGMPNVSRIVVGGTINQLGIQTIGIAETIDVGNFDTSETAVVLLDLLSAAANNPNSLNQFPRAVGTSIIDLIGVGVGNIIAHEAGHFFAAWHTNQTNVPPSLMDQGGSLGNTIGLVGSVWGDGNEIDVDFGPDVFVSNEGFTGTQDSLNAIAFGLSTGKTNSALLGPRLITVDPAAGVSHDLNITSINLTFSEPITAASANDLANYLLIEAGPNGILEDGAGDDVTRSVTPVFDGDRKVELIVGDGNSPLGFGKYRLRVDGDNSIVDLDGNPLNSVTGPGGGSDVVHDFEVVFSVPTGGDFYRIDLAVGQRVTLTTRTPWGDNPLASFGNDLDTQLLVYSNTGQLIVIGSDSADNKNAQATFISAAAGPYFVQVVAESGAGEYLVDLQVEDVVLLGDFNRDGRVDAADYTVWGDKQGQSTSPYSSADGDGNGVVGQPDYQVWVSNFGATFATASENQIVVIGGGSGGGGGGTVSAEIPELLGGHAAFALQPEIVEADVSQIRSVPNVSDGLALENVHTRVGQRQSGLASLREVPRERNLVDFVRPLDFAPRVDSDALLAVFEDWNDAAVQQPWVQLKAQLDCQQDEEIQSSEASDLIFADWGTSLTTGRRARLSVVN